MKSIADLNPRKLPTDPIIDKNLAILYQRLNDFQAVFMDEGGSPFVITSGLRDEALQTKLIDQGKSNAKHSKHLIGAAADIQDKKGLLKKWILENIEYFKGKGLYFEDFNYTKGYVHVQMMPPGSGKMIFIP